MRTELFLGLSLLCMACAPTAEQHTTVVKEDNSNVEPMPEALDAILGQWQDVQDSGRTVFHEHWTKADDGSMTGLGFVMSGSDTVFIEHLAILRGDTGLRYSATIQSQNEGQAVLFDLANRKDSLVFINPAHDFPERITYVPEQDGTMHVAVSGKEAGTYKSKHYHFTRQKTDATSQVE